MLEGGKGKRKTEKGEPLSKFVPFRFVFFLGGGGGGNKASFAGPRLLFVKQQAYSTSINEHPRTAQS